MGTEPEKLRAKGGRPRKYASDERRPTMTFRIRGDMHERLRTEAEAGEVSLSEEIERRLIKSFDMEEQIAVLEERVASMKEREDALWPDQTAKALGRSFVMTLTAVQHATGQGWRESPAAPAIVAGVVRRAMEECGRGGSLFADLFDPIRTGAVTDTIARSVVDDLRAKLPPLPEREPEDDPANWTNLAYLAVVFRDKATGEALETVRGEEYDITASEGRPRLGADYRAALARFEPIRDTVEAEDFVVYRLRDGAQVWDSLTNPGQRTVMRLTGSKEAGRLMVPARGQLPPSIGDRAIFDEVMQAPRPDDDIPSPVPTEPQAAPRRRGRAKATA